MCAALLGGMDRLKGDYIRAAKVEGWKVFHIERDSSDLLDKLHSADLIIIFTNMISHAARRKACDYAKTNFIPLKLCHSCGVSSLRNCLRS